MSEDAVARALAYPFDPPAQGYVFDAGEARAFAPGRDLALIEGRKPILAVGSNASPRRLAEKFGAAARVAVTRAQVRDHVVAHSAKFAAYGSIPATLHPWPGATALVHVTWLDPVQLAIMDETETLGVAYDRAPIAAAFSDVAADGGAETYVSRAGAFGVEGRPLVTASAAHSEPPKGAPLATQREAQQRAARLLGHDGSVEAFIAENVRDAALREARSATLSTRSGLAYGAPARADKL